MPSHTVEKKKKKEGGRRKKDGRGRGKKASRMGMERGRVCRKRPENEK